MVDSSSLLTEVLCLLHLGLLYRQLLTISKEYEEDVVLFHFATFLQEEALDLLGIDGTFSPKLTRHKDGKALRHSGRVAVVQVRVWSVECLVPSSQRFQCRRQDPTGNWFKGC